MTESQRQAVAAGFLHILHVHRDVYDRWIRIPKDDYAAIGKLIKDEVNLAAVPDEADLRAMATYVDEHLRDQTSAIQAANANAPRHVGMIALMQQNS